MLGRVESFVKMVEEGCFCLNHQNSWNRMSYCGLIWSLWPLIRGLQHWHRTGMGVMSAVACLYDESLLHRRWQKTPWQSVSFWSETSSCSGPPLVFSALRVRFVSLGVWWSVQGRAGTGSGFRSVNLATLLSHFGDRKRGGRGCSCSSWASEAWELVAASAMCRAVALISLWSRMLLSIVSEVLCWSLVCVCVLLNPLRSPPLNL